MLGIPFDSRSGRFANRQEVWQEADNVPVSLNVQVHKMKSAMARTPATVALRVLLADDDLLVRDVVRALLERDKTIRVVAETGDGLQVVALAQATDVDIVCMDIDMPGMNGIKATQYLVDSCPNIKVIALSAFSDASYVLDIINAGASAYVTKAAARNELLLAVKAVQEGRKYYCTAAAAVLMTSQLDNSFCNQELSGKVRRIRKP